MERLWESLKFVWLKHFLWIFSLSVFSLIWSVNPGFYVWAYDSLQVSALVEVNLTDTITVARVQSEDRPQAFGFEPKFQYIALLCIW